MTPFFENVQCCVYELVRTLPVYESVGFTLLMDLLY